LNILPSHRGAQELLCPAAFPSKDSSPRSQVSLVSSRELNLRTPSTGNSLAKPPPPIPTFSPFHPIQTPMGLSFTTGFREPERSITLKVHLAMSGSTSWRDLEISNRTSIRDLMTKIDRLFSLSSAVSKQYWKISSSLLNRRKGSVMQLIYQGGVAFGAVEVEKRQTVYDMEFQDDDGVVVETML
jgi:hypothetical protein